MLEDSVLISKAKETVAPDDLLRRSMSKKMAFHKLSDSSHDFTKPKAGFSDIENVFREEDEHSASRNMGSHHPGAIVPVAHELDEDA
jgi:hypothetical protein